jgi:peptidoglycan/LPS O-acetylase OafA/YrhL
MPELNDAAVTPPRTPALDGIRGAFTLMVIVSHFFGEVPNGWDVAKVGWVGVIGYFALSGFLIGRLILERMAHVNFVTVFYVRRFLRLMPPYFIVLLAAYGIYGVAAHRHWVDVDHMFPAWTYLTFTQNFYMVHSGSIGPHWLAPTWTLAVEEHFYLIAPAALMFTPRRHLLKSLLVLGVASLALRIAIFEFGVLPSMAGRTLLACIADTIIAGMIAATLWKTEGFPWARYDVHLRAGAPVLLFVAALLQVIDNRIGTSLFATFGTTLMAIGLSCLLLALMRNAPEARRFESPLLCFFGHTAYCIYLTHLTVLGLMHGLILGSRPDVATPEQMLVTCAAFGVSISVGWAFYKTVEEPCMAYARRFTWSAAKRSTAGAGVPAAAKLAN